MNGYGPLSQIVAYAGMIMAMGGAIFLAFKGREKFEPSAEEIPLGPQRVGGLVSSAIIVIVWLTATITMWSFLVKLVFSLLVLTILFFLVYLYLILEHTYIEEIVVDNRTNPVKTKHAKIIGGFNLTEHAKRELNKRKNITIQKLFAGSGYQRDLIWTHRSQTYSKLSFVMGYLGLSICGTVALGMAAILLILRTH